MVPAKTWTRSSCTSRPIAPRSPRAQGELGRRNQRLSVCSPAALDALGRMAGRHRAGLDDADPVGGNGDASHAGPRRGRRTAAGAAAGAGAGDAGCPARRASGPPHDLGQQRSPAGWRTPAGRGASPGPGQRCPGVRPAGAGQLAGLVFARAGAARRPGDLFLALFGGGVHGTVLATAVLCSAFTAITGDSGVTILALGGLLLPLPRHAGDRRSGWVHRVSSCILRRAARPDPFLAIGGSGWECLEPCQATARMPGTCPWLWSSVRAAWTGWLRRWGLVLPSCLSRGRTPRAGTTAAQRTGFALGWQHRSTQRALHHRAGRCAGALAVATSGCPGERGPRGSRGWQRAGRGQTAALPPAG